MRIEVWYNYEYPYMDFYFLEHRMMEKVQKPSNSDGLSYLQLIHALCRSTWNPVEAYEVCCLSVDIKQLKNC
jgi:hypothetical protein